MTVAASAGDLVPGIQGAAWSMDAVILPGLRSERHADEERENEEKRGTRLARDRLRSRKERVRRQSLTKRGVRSLNDRRGLRESARKR